MGSGGLTESIDDLAAEEINELEGVLVLDRQAHEKLGTGRSAEPLLDFLAGFRGTDAPSMWYRSTKACSKAPRSLKGFAR